MQSYLVGHTVDGYGGLVVAIAIAKIKDRNPGTIG
jgi:hypothetical protein